MEKVREGNVNMNWGYIIYAIVALVGIFVLVWAVNKMSVIATREIFLTFFKTCIYAIVAVLSFVSSYEENSPTELFRWLTAAIYLAAVFETITNGAVIVEYFRDERKKKESQSN